MIRAFLLALLMVASPALAQQRNYIENTRGTRLGYTVVQGDRTVAYDRTGRRLGYYDARTNKTHDATGRIIARGNVVVSLIPMQR